MLSEALLLASLLVECGCLVVLFVLLWEYCSTSRVWRVVRRLVSRGERK